MGFLARTVSLDLRLCLILFLFFHVYKKKPFADSRVESGTSMCVGCVWRSDMEAWHDNRGKCKCSCLIRHRDFVIFLRRTSPLMMQEKGMLWKNAISIVQYRAPLKEPHKIHLEFLDVGCHAFILLNTSNPLILAKKN